MVVDMTSKGVNGREAEEILDEVGISVSRSTIPNDPNPPMKPSGVRLGTPAITTRGMKENDMKKIANWIEEAIKNKNSENELNKIKENVKEFCLKFPMPGV